MAGKKPKTDDAPAEKKSGGGLIGMIILSVSAIAASFGASYLLTPAEAAPVETECSTHEAVKVSEPVYKDQSFVALDEILITIGSEPATRFLKMDVSIVTSSDYLDIVEQDAPVLIDAFINYLRSVELEDFEDPAFYAQMREQLSRRSELILGASASDGVLVTSFLLR